MVSKAIPDSFRAGSERPEGWSGGGNGFEMGQNNHYDDENKTKNEQERGATWPATQVGLRPVEAGLGGHDDGASGVNEGVKSTSTRSWKRGRFALSGHAAFSVFAGADSEFAGENRNDLKG